MGVRSATHQATCVLQNTVQALMSSSASSTHSWRVAKLIGPISSLVTAPSPFTSMPPRSASDLSRPQLTKCNSPSPSLPPRRTHLMPRAQSVVSGTSIAVQPRYFSQNATVSGHRKHVDSAVIGAAQ